MENLKNYLIEGRLDTSAKMLAVLGFFYGIELTTPIIKNLRITNDGDVLAQVSDLDKLVFISNAEDLQRTLNEICDVMNISNQECQELMTIFDGLISEGRESCHGLSPLGSYIIGCSIWSRKKEPNNIVARYCRRSYRR